MRRMNHTGRAGIVGVLVLLLASAAWGQSLWELAKANRDTLTISTLFTAQDVRDRLSSDAGIDQAIDWCKKTGVTRVFVETFRDGYTAEKSALEHARDRLIGAGIDVSGCVTPTNVGKKSTGWAPISCYTDEPTRKRVQEIFEFTASIFDEIMIDDFWFTDCECPECQTARGDQSWSQYRCDLMVKVSRERILRPPVRSIPRSRSSSSTRNGMTSSTIADTRSCARRRISTEFGSARRPATTRTSNGAARSSTRHTISCDGSVRSADPSAAAAGSIPTARTRTPTSNKPARRSWPTLGRCSCSAMARCLMAPVRPTSRDSARKSPAC